MVTVVQKRAETVVIIEWVVLALEIIGAIICMAVALLFYDPVANWLSNSLIEKRKQSSGPKMSESQIRQALQIVLIVVGVFVLITSIINFLLTRLLSQGVHLRIRRKVNIWYTVKVVFFILGLLGFVVSTVQAASPATNILSCFANLIVLAYRFVTLWIVKKFLTELEGTDNGVLYSSTINDHDKV